MDMAKDLDSWFSRDSFLRRGKKWPGYSYRRTMPEGSGLFMERPGPAGSAMDMPASIVVSPGAAGLAMGHTENWNRNWTEDVPEVYAYAHWLGIMDDSSAVYSYRRMLPASPRAIVEEQGRRAMDDTSSEYYYSWRISDGPRLRTMDTSSAGYLSSRIPAPGGGGFRATEGNRMWMNEVSGGYRFSSQGIVPADGPCPRHLDKQRMSSYLRRSGGLSYWSMPSEDMRLTTSGAYRPRRMSPEGRVGPIGKLPWPRVVDQSGRCRRIPRNRKFASRKAKLGFHIPHDVLFLILARLPARSLIRFKCVCKLWHAIIQDPQFISRHLLTRSDMPNLNILTLSWMPRIHEFSLHYFAEDCYKFDMRGAERQDDDFRISNSCDGLICVFGQTITYLVNPSIREVVELPTTQQHSDVSVALGHDISTGEYKIVRMYQQTYGTMRCMVLTLGSHSWRFVGNSPFPLPSIIPPVVVNGFIVWGTYHDARYGRPEIAVSFDIKNETIDTIDHPKGSSKCKISFITEIGGYLCILDIPEPKADFFHRELWILVDHRNRRWINHSINLHKMENVTNGTASELVLLAIRGEKILTSNQRGRFDFYDPGTGCFDKLPLYLTYGCATPYVESLISPVAIAIQENAVGWRLSEGVGAVHHDCRPWWLRLQQQQGDSNEHDTAASCSVSGTGCCCSKSDCSWWPWRGSSSGNSNDDDGFLWISETLWPKSTPKGLIVYS